ISFLVFCRSVDAASRLAKQSTPPTYQNSNILEEPTMSDPRLTYDAFAKAADESGLDKSIVELAKLRVSQINKCAFCLQIHLNVARRLGIAAEKIDLV